MARLTRLRDGLQRLPPKVKYLERTTRETDLARKQANPMRSQYGTARWQKLRMQVLVRDLFTCQWPGCGRIESDTSQLVADHKTPHRGDPALFWDDGNLWCLCKRCHDSAKQRQEAADRRKGGWL